MFHLVLVSTEEDEAGRENKSDGLHGTAIFKRALKIWAGSGRIVCAGSYFSSVETTQQVQVMGLEFIGVLKTATTKDPTKYLSEHEMEQCGDWHSVVPKDGDGKTVPMAVFWIDRERRYFISNIGTTENGTPYE